MDGDAGYRFLSRWQTWLPLIDAIAEATEVSYGLLSDDEPPGSKFDLRKCIAVEPLLQRFVAMDTVIAQAAPDELEEPELWSTGRGIPVNSIASCLELLRGIQYDFVRACGADCSGRKFEPCGKCSEKNTAHVDLWTLTRASNNLGMIRIVFSVFIERRAIETLGVWGEYFFSTFNEQLRSQLVNDGLPVGPALQHANLPLLPTLDPKRFTVRVKGRNAAFIGNNNCWLLLSALWEQANQFVSVLQLAEAMGKDSLYDPKYDKLRLMKQLKQGGYGDLADCIRSTVGHYGLFIETATKMQP